MAERSGRECSPQPSVPARGVSFTADNLPLSFEHWPDVALPAKLWSAWQDQNKPRTIRRALEDGERIALERRAASLAACLEPFRRPHEDDRVAIAIDELFASYSSMREADGGLLARIKGYSDSLADMPAWAIEEACKQVRGRGYEVVTPDGRKRTEQTFAPSEAQLHGIVEKVVEQRTAALRSARALLTAPVEFVPIPVAGRPVADVLEEFKARNPDAVEAMEAIEARRRQMALAAMKQRHLDGLRAQYRAAGLAVPDGDSFTSLSMMLHLGWTITRDQTGANVLLAPRKP